MKEGRKEREGMRDRERGWGRDGWKEGGRQRGVQGRGSHA